MFVSIASAAAEQVLRKQGRQLAGVAMMDRVAKWFPFFQNTLTIFLADAPR